MVWTSLVMLTARQELMPGTAPTGLRVGLWVRPWIDIEAWSWLVQNQEEKVKKHGSMIRERCDKLWFKGWMKKFSYDMSDAHSLVHYIYIFDMRIDAYRIFKFYIVIIGVDVQWFLLSRKAHTLYVVFSFQRHQKLNPDGWARDRVFGIISIFS